MTEFPTGHTFRLRSPAAAKEFSAGLDMRNVQQGREVTLLESALLSRAGATASELHALFDAWGAFRRRLADTTGTSSVPTHMLPLARAIDQLKAVNVGPGVPALEPKSGTAISGSVGLAVPFTLAALVAVLPVMVAESSPLSPEVVTVIVGLLGLAGMAKIVTGLLVDAKKLREKPPEHHSLPNPVVVRSADQFASQEQVQKIETDLRNQMKELRAYVHEAVHVINQSVGKISQQLHDQGEATQEFFTRLDAKNEARVQRIADRVDEVIDRTPEKIIGLLKTTGVIKS